MTVTLAAGRFPFLSYRDFARDDIPYTVTATGVVRGQNTTNGPRILVEVEFPDRPDRREFFVNMKSKSYIRLCSHFGENLATWRGPFTVRVVKDARDGRRRVEVQS